MSPDLQRLISDFNCCASCCVQIHDFAVTLPQRSRGDSVLNGLIQMLQILIWVNNRDYPWPLLCHISMLLIARANKHPAWIIFDRESEKFNEEHGEKYLGRLSQDVAPATSTIKGNIDYFSDQFLMLRAASDLHSTLADHTNHTHPKSAKFINTSGQEVKAASLFLQTIIQELRQGVFLALQMPDKKNKLVWNSSFASHAAVTKLLSRTLQPVWSEFDIDGALDETFDTAVRLMVEKPWSKHEYRGKSATSTIPPPEDLWTPKSRGWLDQPDSGAHPRSEDNEQKAPPAADFDNLNQEFDAQIELAFDDTNPLIDPEDLQGQSDEVLEDQEPKTSRRNRKPKGRGSRGGRARAVASKANVKNNETKSKRKSSPRSDADEPEEEDDREIKTVVSDEDWVDTKLDAPTRKPKKPKSTKSASKVERKTESKSKSKTKLTSRKPPNPCEDSDLMDDERDAAGSELNEEPKLVGQAAARRQLGDETASTLISNVVNSQLLGSSPESMPPQPVSSVVQAPSESESRPRRGVAKGAGFWAAAIGSEKPSRRPPKVSSVKVSTCGCA